MFKPRYILTILLMILFFNSVNAITIFYDNFNDGSITDWDVNGGTWSAATFKVVGGGADGSSLSHTVAMIPGSAYTIEYKNNPNSVGLSNSFAWFTDQNDVDDFRGYRVVTRTDGIQLLRANVGGTTTSLYSDSVPIAAGTDHNISIYHQTDGNIQVIVDSNVRATVTDTTYTSGTKIFFGSSNTAADGIWDDVNITVAGTRAITVLRPIDEKTLIPIYKPWTVSVSGTSIQYLDNNASSKVFILPDTNGVANFLVDDSNTVSDQYFPRNYIVYSDSNTGVTIQPYLVSTLDGVEVVVIVKDNTIGNPTLPGIRLILKTGISGVNTTVEDSLTNFAGASEFTLIHHKDYLITATDDAQTVTYFPIIAGTNTISDTSDTFVLFINFTDTNLSLNRTNYDINIAPNVDFFTGVTQQVDVNVDVNFSFSIIKVQAFDGNILIMETNSTSSPFLTNLVLNLPSFDTNNVRILVQIVTPDYNVNVYKNYLVSNIPLVIVDQIRGIRNWLGPTSLLMIMFFAMILTFGIIGESPIGNNESRIFIFVIEVGFFVWLWFFDNPWVVLVFCGAILGTAGLYLYSKNRGN